LRHSVGRRPVRMIQKFTGVDIRFSRIVRFAVTPHTGRSP
jgi:hypothetical protein